jgi:hypothetical protein
LRDGRLEPASGELEQALKSHERFVGRKPGGRRALLNVHDLSPMSISFAAN